MLSEVPLQLREGSPCKLQVVGRCCNAAVRSFVFFLVRAHAGGCPGGGQCCRQLRRFGLGTCPWRRVAQLALSWVHGLVLSGHLLGMGALLLVI